MATAEAQFTHRALDGRQFLLSGQLEFGLPATSVVGVVIHGRLHEFTAGATSLADDVARALGVDGFAEELAYQGGTLLIGRARPHDPQTRLTEELVLVAWRGRRYCAVTQMYGMPTAAVLATLRTLRISEHDDGLTLLPISGAGSDFAGPATVIKQVPELGLLELSPLTTAHTRQLPSWRGLVTPAGEVFRDTLSNGDPYFVVAGAETWTTVVPLADTAPDRVPALLGRLRVQTVG